MSNLNLDKIVEAVKALTPDEQRQVRDLLNELLTSLPAQPREDELGRALVKARLLSELEPQGVDVELYRQYKPIAVRGQPVSTTLIEERR